MTALRIGFIGAGGIARSRHLPNLKELAGVQVVAVANRSAQSSQRVAEEFGIPEVMDDWQSLVARDDLDAIFIGTWPYTHREMSVAVLESGKHCFCQARMAGDLAEARQMVEAAKKYPKQVNMICPPPQRMPYEPYIRQVLAQGQLGDIVGVDLTSTSGANLRPTITWREQTRYSGKQILAMGIWAETLNAWFGPYQSLSAVTHRPITHKPNEQGEQVAVDIPQVVMIAGRLTSGAVIREYHSGLVADSTSRLDQLTIHGLKGTLRVRGPVLEMGLPGEALKPVQVPAELTRPWQVERDFVQAVRAAQAGETWSVSPDFEEGLLYMRKVEAVHLAAQSGRAVDPATL